MKKILMFISMGILLVSLVSAGWFTGNVVWAGDWCSAESPCPAGEGDCDKNEDCLTGYCAQNVGRNYRKFITMDVCEEPLNSSGSSSGTKSKVMQNSSSTSGSSSSSSSSGSDASSVVTYQGVLDMLSRCGAIGTSKSSGTWASGQSICASRNTTCVFTWEERNGETIIDDCEISKYSSTYFASLCCSPDPNSQML